MHHRQPPPAARVARNAEGGGFFVVNRGVLGHHTTIVTTSSVPSADPLPASEKVPKGSVSWSVCTPFVQQICDNLGAGEPVLDCFANSSNQHFPRWWREGGEHQDAFSQDWGKVGLLWCNPPSSKLSQMVAKVEADHAYMILIVPRWRRTEKWWWDLQKYVKAQQELSPGTPFF